MRVAPYRFTRTILSGRPPTQRETGHTDESGYIKFCGLCDDGHHPGRASFVDLPAANCVRRRHIHSIGP